MTTNGRAPEQKQEVCSLWVLTLECFSTLCHETKTKVICSDFQERFDLPLVPMRFS